MSIKSLKPSIAFNGTCAGAIALYERALGAKIVQRVHFRDGAKMGHPFADEDADRVLNATLAFADTQLMVMDSPSSRPVPPDSSVAVFVDFDDASELDRSFEALSKDGEITMPVANTFWGSRFGMLRDAFGVRWMLSHELRKS